MHALPILQRELIVASRRRGTWRLRLAFAGGAGIAFLWGLGVSYGPNIHRGQTALMFLAIAGFNLSLFCGPFLTADAISVEKRERTLGLLFLTPLDAFGIVTGKLATHGLQAVASLVGTFPFLFLTLLLGSVTPTEVIRLLAAQLVVLLISLSCALLWSTLVDEARGAILGSAASLLAVVLLPLAFPFLVTLMERRPLLLNGVACASPLTPLLLAFEAQYRGGAAPFALSLGFGILLAVALTGVTAWLLPRSWRRAESGALQPRVDSAAGHRPLAGDDEPLIWAMGRAVVTPLSLRIFGWTSAACFVSLVVVLSSPQEESPFMVACFSAYGLHLLTRIHMALTTTHWMHQAHRSGALELLLTTPISDQQLVAAHHDSLKQGMKPAFRNLLLLNLVLEVMVFVVRRRHGLNDTSVYLFTLFFMGGAALTWLDFVALRWLGLREGLRQGTHALAAGVAFARLQSLSWIGFAITVLLVMRLSSDQWAVALFTVWMLGSSVWSIRLIHEGNQWIKPGLRRRISGP